MKLRILVIAGSDSSGGAGLEADQKVIAAYGCYAMTATTALTAQNTQGVADIHMVPTSFVKKQVELCVEDVGVDVVKTGMLASEESVKAVADLFTRYSFPISVVDPVTVSTSGAQLLPHGAIDTLRKELLPLTTVLTPNIPEAKLLLESAGRRPQEPLTISDLVDMAKDVQSLGPQYVLLKGGHLPLNKDRIVSAPDAAKHLVVDILYGHGRDLILESEYINSKHTHGTGCSLASAIASRLALGDDVPTAVKAAKQYVEAGIRTSPGLGKGSGPINHFHSTYTLPFAPGRFVDYLLDRPDVKQLWHQHTHHPFVQQMAAGTLPLASFKYYLVQDYLYLVQFSRANALAAYKASSVPDIAASAAIVAHIHTEMALHVSYCESFGIPAAELAVQPEAQACTAYTRYMLDVGAAQDWFALQVAFAPCLLGYGAIAARLVDDAATVKGEGNVYWRWIENYVAEDYTQAVNVGRDLLEKHAVLQSVSRIEELVRVFIHATKMEIGFWEMGAGGTGMA